ncbi:hypothetical protein H3146_26910 [Streptomyces sp. OF3]|uniref:Uncharacterized protein n=1 Tax=Streptomyces alkaliterrae TaxID=2213162 RepID=A0A7W3WRI1_9ACTN|nr:hypothetical protein [Streptomyces alkaliterrae]MBB1256940.1 hypothetical protein [Streptomyces alkaliterrae]
MLSLAYVDLLSLRALQDEAANPPQRPVQPEPQQQDLAAAHAIDMPGAQDQKR